MFDELYNEYVIPLLSNPLLNNPYILPVLIILASVVLGFVLRWGAKKWLKRLAERATGQYDEMLVDALRRSILYIVVLSGINIALREMPKAAKIMQYARPMLLACFILLLSYIIAKVLKMFVKIRAANEQDRIATVSLTRRSIEFVVYTVAAVMILRVFGVEITPIITALGIGGLAVALALQDTLSNAFSGIYITLASQIRVGDYIRTSDGFEGYVRDIGWRNTTIEMQEMNIVLIPNNKLAQAIVINYNLPSEIQYLLLTFGVHHQTDPQLVEDTLVALALECGHATQEEAFAVEQPPGKIRGLLHTPEAVVRFREFGEYTLNFRFLIAISHFDLQFEARHNVMKQLYYRFKKAGIIVPVPIRVLNFGNGSAPALAQENGISSAEQAALATEMREVLLKK